jgi:hypothetical protein
MLQKNAVGRGFALDVTTKRCGKRVLHHGARGVLAIEGGPEVEDDVQQEHNVNEKIKVVCPRRFVVGS